MKSLTLVGWLPLEFLPFIVVGAALLMIIGAKKASYSLLGMALMMAILPPILEPFLSMLPLWALLALGAIAIVVSIKDLASLGKSEKKLERERKRFKEKMSTLVVILAAGFLFYMWITGQI